MVLIVSVQKKRVKRDKARGENRMKSGSKGRRQQQMEGIRIMQVAERGRIIKAQTPSGRRQRQVASTVGFVDKGRDGGKKLARHKKFGERVMQLRQVEARVLGKEDVNELRRKVVFYRGSREHKVKLPDVDKEKDVKREIWNPIIGEQESGMKVIDSPEGMKIQGHDVWLVPRRESLQHLGKDGSVQWIYDMLSTVESKSGKSNARQKDSGKRIVALDGQGSKCTILGTQVRLCGRGLTTNMRSIPRLEITKQKEFGRYVKKVEHLMQVWLDPVSHDTMKAVQESNDEIGLHLGRGQKSGLWCSIAFGRNVSLCLHTDDDFTLGLVQVFGEEGDEGAAEDILAYFCFPTLSLCVALRSGDTLVFNAALDHCVSSRVNGRKNMQCVSFYVNYQIPSGKDNRGVKDGGKEGP